MFDTAGTKERGLSWPAPAAPAVVPSDDWAWPGRPSPAPAPVVPDPGVTALVSAVDALLEQDPSVLPGPVALDRTRRLLAQQGRLEAALGTALLDVEVRELFALDATGSTTGWLRRQPAGEVGRLARSRRLQRRTCLRAAVAAGTVGPASADVVCRALDQLPAAAPEGQVEGVLTGAVPELLSRWTAGTGHDEALADARAAVVADAVEQALAAAHLSPAERLEPAFALVAQALDPAVLADQLQLLVDALAPERLTDAEAAAYDDRALRLRKKRRLPGWRLTGDLTDEVGQALHAELEARARLRRQEQGRLDDARTGTPAGDDEHFGTVGPGRVPAPGDAPVLEPDGWTTALRGPAELTDEQLAHDLLGELLDDLAAGGDGTRRPRPAALSLTAGLELLEGRLGCLPGSAVTPAGPAAVSLASLRRAGCDGVLDVVLLDAARRPVGASGTHRHATERERRALHARWGDYCSVDGCGSTRTVPHHVRPWWKTGRTRLDDLVPLCDGDHWHVHNGHRVLLLRDGRRIDEDGWAAAEPVRRPPPGARSPSG